MTNRPIMRDVAYKTSSTNASFIERLNNAIALDKAQKDLGVGIGPAFDNWKPVLEANQQKTLEEMKVKGYTQAHTDIIERVAAASERDSAKSWEVRQREWLDKLAKKEEDTKRIAERKWKSEEEEFADLERAMENDYSYMRVSEIR